MEIEVKLRLPNKASHQKVLQLLSPFHITTHHQHNTFFDGTAKAVITNGVSRIEEDEEEVDPFIGYACLEDPGKLMNVDSRVLGRVKEEFGANGFKGLGGFRTVKSVYEWNGVKLEVDEVKYEFGDLYEVECENVEPKKVKGMIETFFKENGIEYSESLMSKFTIFRAAKLPS
ncbi:triphosphate tunel metalloenzyme 3-like [Olea europaea var. sylvestris]|uniref:triphosphate tunel metalloenzyme 3-like n=1 Tax=Olea europaea var. sylvestris TaxID=158386 RepID=UPI000C1D8BD2|nr:triphosphate tunel metalloenzyme 3-like [Olea europaea var. sylvestris]